jgi:endonuclease YncB( thermonuclease family)
MRNNIVSFILRNETNSRNLHKLTGSYTCKVVDVYDGDTITITILNNCAIQKYKLRMYGYDSPEMKPKKTLENRDEEIANAKKAKQFLIDLVYDKICTVDLMGFDKYGRLLGTLFSNNMNINKYMVQNGHGYEYFGGTKKVN